MRYDEERNTLDVSVRELAYLEHERGAGVGGFAQLRTELGRLVHRRVQQTLAPGESEVPLLIERGIDGVRCRVRGRADVVRYMGAEPGTGCVVEEIKSVFELGPEQQTDEDRDHASARLQVQLYALALADEGHEDVRAKLVLVEIEGEGRRELDVDFDRTQVERLLSRALRRRLVLALAEAERARARREKAAAIEFPFAQMRPGQQDIVATIAQALASDHPVMLCAPTGTGKTVVALVPALREALRRGASVWYLTAKTTQRQLAADTFEAVQRASGITLRAVVTRRKEDMCPPGHLRCDPAICPLIADFSERAAPVVRELGELALLTPDHLLERGRATQLCPYELMHARIEQADVVVADHSHVYDPRRSRAFEGRRLVIVDEAHNLVDRAREMASVFVPRRLAALEHPPALAGPLARLHASVAEAIDAALKLAAEDERATHEGQTTTELEAATWQELGLEAGMQALRYASIRQRAHEFDPRDPVLEALETIAFAAELAADTDPALAGYLAGPDAASGAGVGIVCLDPGRRLELLHRQQVGVVVMSATLEPLDYFADVLGLARLDPQTICAPSNFPADNRCVCVVPSVRTTFGERDDHAEAIAGHIAQVIAIAPGNYAAFFQSFRYLATVSAQLDRGALERAGIDVLIQPPGASEAIRARFLDRLTRSGKPTLLLAVTSGVFSEGIDLPGDALIGAIIVGPALPALSFERLLMQAHHAERGLDHEGAFAYAMAYPGMQRVIQAAGRVHRTPEDRGVIVLLGGRFCEPPYCDALPSHWYDYAPDELRTDDLGARLRRFWGEGG